jgi:glycosyltransferase involved in cell wall biosynthesis
MTVQANAPPRWICCQLGAREYYAIPRALHQTGHLAQLLTDAWVTPKSPLEYIPITPFKALRERFHPDLADAPVRAFTNPLLRFEVSHQLRKTSGWERIIARNTWFQKQVIHRLKHRPPQSAAIPPILFSYSYAARDLFQYAKTQGWTTVLGQIDPGYLEEQIVQVEQCKHPTLAPQWQPTPPEYWQLWQEECSLADRILVNSEWSQQLLVQAGILPSKIQIVPLVYQPAPEANLFSRVYPTQFSPSRPLRVLFLGLLTLRKGIAAVLDAITQLEGQPIEFWFVGPLQIDIPPVFQSHPQVHWVEKVSRSKAQHHYQAADVFLFPTLSDGFGLTQLEAQAWKLPIIASNSCGTVVEHQVNGLVLAEVTGTAIAQTIRSLLNQPLILTELSQNISTTTQFNLKTLNHHLQSIVPEPSRFTQNISMEV